MNLKIIGLILGLLIPAVSVHAQSAKYMQIERSVIEDRLRQYEGKTSRREAAIKRLFEEAGCSATNLKEQRVPATPAPNVLCTLPGSTDETIIVGAHFDKVDMGDGVADNWSGASLLASLFQSLSTISRKHTFVFIGFVEEEEGMVGSKYYANSLSQAEISQIQAMIDMDTLGLGPTEIWVSNSDPGLVKKLVALAGAMKLPIRGANVDKVGDSDGRSFKNRNVPIITLHSVTSENLRILHSYRDNLSAIKLDDYYDSYKLIAAYLAYLDTTLEPMQ